MFVRNAIAVLSMIAAPAALAADPPHFEYSGEHGPDKWSTLSAAYGACSAGKSQSPVNIDSAHHASLPALEIRYSTLATAFVNNGHAVQANYAAGSTLADDYHQQAPYKSQVNYSTGSSIGHLGATFELKQFHFHSPSEHQHHGKNAAAEMHFVHADADGNLAVIGVFVEEGAENPVIARLWQSIPETAGQSNPLGTAINGGDLLPKDRSYYYYQGSLTTPPCSEGVRWLVMRHTVTMSAAQIAELKKAIGFDNNRPVQPLNGRVIFR